MANTERRILDDKGRQFIPMNMEGTLGEENFITMPKLLTLAYILGSTIAVFVISRSNGYSILGTMIILIVVEFINSLLLRYIVFEEKLYYKMYRELKDGNVISPYKFWNIASKQNTDRGTILNYNDAKTGVIVKLQRDVITGRGEDLKEVHFDAVSDFYKELNKRKIKRVYMNVMENIGNDQRLNELDKLCNTTDNYNLNRLVELSITYIKNISNSTLTDVEYYLLYVEQIVEYTQFLNDVEDCLSILMNGAYKSYEILGAQGGREINEFAKKINFVEYFNTDEASLSIFNTNSNVADKIKVVQVNISDSEQIELNQNDYSRIKYALGSGKYSGLKIADIIRNTVGNRDNTVGVDIGDIEEKFINSDSVDTSYVKEENNDTDNNMIDF